MAAARVRGTVNSTNYALEYTHLAAYARVRIQKAGHSWGLGLLKTDPTSHICHSFLKSLPSS